MSPPDAPAQPRTVLVTNDDGVNSPFLASAIQWLKALDLRVIVVAPATEQSWKGKSMTRGQTLAVGEIEIAGHPCHTLAGTPGGCVNFALHTLLRGTTVGRT